MRQIITKIMIVIGVIIFLVCLGYYLNRFHLSSDLYIKGKFRDNTDFENTLKIGLIGDSWVKFGRLDSIIHNRLNDVKIDNEIIYSGQGGNTTRETYKNIYKSDTVIYSSKKVIDSHPKYCIVISGINDSNGQFGEKYYSHHLFLIIETLIKEKILPIVISIPNYSIEEQFSISSKFMRMRYKTFALINNEGKINNIQNYNNRFIEDLKQSPYKDSIIYINMNKTFKRYDKDSSLFFDYLHFNLKGRQYLGEIITDTIESRERKDADLVK